jgi:hypothetical protein
VLMAVPIGVPTTVAEAAKEPTVPAVGPAGAPTTVVVAKEPVMPAVGPVRATMKGGPTEGWGHAATVVPTAVPAGVPVATTAPTTHSREAATVA